MSLLIPDILQNAASVVKASRALGYTPTDEEIKNLHHLSKMVAPEDILAALAEIGTVYAGMSNFQIQRIASAPDLVNKKFALIMVIAPMGIEPRQLTIPLTIEQAQNLIKSFQDTLNALLVTDGKLIMPDGGNA